MRRTSSLRVARCAVCALAVSVVFISMPAMSLGAGFATPGVGIKARSMGGAFRGLADDWSAASHNPAGLAFLETSELNVTMGIYNPRLTYNPDILTGEYDVDIGFEKASSSDHYPIEDLWPQPSFAAMAVNPEWEGFVFGGAIFWPYDVNYAWDLFRQPLTYASDYGFQEQNYRTDLDVLDIHPTAAKMFGEDLAVGLGLSFTSADLVYRRLLFVDNELGPPFNDWPYRQFIGDFRLEGNGFSLGANAGILWKASDNVSIGVSGQTPISVNIEGLATLDMAWPVNEQLTVENDGLAIGDFDGDSDPDTIRTQLFFSGVNDPLVQEQNQPRTTAEYELDLDLPAQLGVGIGWTASDKITVAVDAVLTFWSVVDEWKILIKGPGLNAGIDSINVVPHSFGWDDQLRVSGGIEYAAKENLMLRGGAYYDGAAAPDATFSPNFPNDADAIGITGGLAWIVDGHWEFSYAQEVAFSSDRSVEAPEGAFSGRDVFPGEYTSTRFESILSIAYRF